MSKQVEEEKKLEEGAVSFIVPQNDEQQPAPNMQIQARNSQLNPINDQILGQRPHTDPLNTQLHQRQAPLVRDPHRLEYVPIDAQHPQAHRNRVQGQFNDVHICIETFDHLVFGCRLNPNLPTGQKPRRELLRQLTHVGNGEWAIWLPGKWLNELGRYRIFKSWCAWKPQAALKVPKPRVAQRPRRYSPPRGSVNVRIPAVGAMAAAPRAQAARVTNLVQAGRANMAMLNQVNEMNDAIAAYTSAEMIGNARDFE
jgi:hypothetical protein